jgi:hypothetical protein
VALGQGEVLEVGEEVERVVGAGAVGAEADRYARCACRRVGEDAADGQLHIGDRVGNDGAAAGGDQCQLLLVEPDAVGEDGALAEHAEAVEVGGRAQAVSLDALPHLVLGLGEVDVDRDPALSCAFGGPTQQPFADRVDRVGRQGGIDLRAIAGQLVEVAQGALLHRLRLAVGVEERTADSRAQAGVGDRARCGRRVPVHVPEARGAGADHLQAGQAGGPVDVVGFELGLDRPDHLLQPAHQRQVAAVAAEKRHRRVGVAVEERGEQR